MRNTQLSETVLSQCQPSYGSSVRRDSAAGKPLRGDGAKPCSDRAGSRRSKVFPACPLPLFDFPNVSVTGRSHIFDGVTKTSETAAFQLCDITDPMLKEMIEDEDEVRDTCNVSLIDQPSFDV